MSGRLFAPVREKYLQGRILTAEEMGIMRAYLLQWILSYPTPYADRKAREQLWMLRVTARHLETMVELHRWLYDALEFGADPL
ncbi:MAG TPA: hypothetical protein VGG59_07605 [Acidobacteriaceae bacterium]